MSRAKTPVLWQLHLPAEIVAMIFTHATTDVGPTAIFRVWNAWLRVSRSWYHGMQSVRRTLPFACIENLTLLPWDDITNPTPFQIDRGETPPRRLWKHIQTRDYDALSDDCILYLIHRGVRDMSLLASKGLTQRAKYDKIARAICIHGLGGVRFRRRARGKLPMIRADSLPQLARGSNIITMHILQGCNNAHNGTCDPKVRALMPHLCYDRRQERDPSPCDRRQERDPITSSTQTISTHIARKPYISTKRFEREFGGLGMGAGHYLLPFCGDRHHVEHWLREITLRTNRAERYGVASHVKPIIESIMRTKCATRADYYTDVFMHKAKFGQQPIWVPYQYIDRAKELETKVILRDELGHGDTLIRFVDVASLTKLIRIPINRVFITESLCKRVLQKGFGKHDLAETYTLLVVICAYIPVSDAFLRECVPFPKLFRREFGICCRTGTEYKLTLARLRAMKK